MNRHRGINARIGLVGLWVLVTVGAAWADGSPFVGRWHLNLARSKAPPGDVMPADMVADFARVEANHVKWIVTVTDAQGRPSVEAFDTPANGEFYPISSDTTAAFTLTDNALQGTFKGPSGEMDSLTCTLSHDNQAMTCKGLLSPPNEKAQPYVDVYDRM